MRLKRGITLSLEDGLFFQIFLPGIEWEKVVGNAALGMSFGLVVRNQMELELSK